SSFGHESSRSRIENHTSLNAAAQDVSLGSSGVVLREDVLQVLEVAVAFAQRRNLGSSRGSLHAARALIVAEEKESIPDDRTTDRCTELVETIFTLMRVRGIVLEPVGCIELVIAEELPDIAMQGVGTGLHSSI